MSAPPTVRLPRTINSATKRLTALDGIANSTGWERAAIVWACTYEGRPGPSSVEISTELHTITSFAKLGIVGLSSKDSVIRYRDAWKIAMAAGEAEDVKLGQAVVLPSSEFPPGEVSLRNNSAPEKVAERMERDPEYAEKVLSRVPAKAIAKQARKPEVAKEVVDDHEASRGVTKARVVRRQSIVERNRAQRDTDTKAQHAKLQDAAGAAALPSFSTDFSAIERDFVQMRTRWRQAVRKQTFSDMDLSYMAQFAQHQSDHQEEIDTFVEAQANGQDPYAAVEALLKARNDEQDLGIDLWEQGVAPDALDEIERYANEASS